MCMWLLVAPGCIIWGNGRSSDLFYLDEGATFFCFSHNIESEAVAVVGHFIGEGWHSQFAVDVLFLAPVYAGHCGPLVSVNMTH